MTDDPFDTPEWESYAQRVRDELVPMIEGSAVTLTLVPDGPPDVKLAVELGFCLLMDKPIISVVKPGVKVPKKLRAIADEIVVGEPGDPAFDERLVAAINRMKRRLK